ncbi:MAG: hypothetical protein ACD_81C00044G0003 [uncultured bacterium]|uniref:Protecting protein DprA protein n=2 Tax=Candidatus Wolfeibacteriota TaxID=1752735 RepID=A0A0G1HA84_9BACT|nr:MAG: hypothetical protein ACD_81C00044G0003 [uncultured bacterium]KKR12501.1 MAG: protecting protein DprA protein [Candidatus Wolfebacteria bacterium GW2011_GWC2_39_22]KKT43458.1 MAG: protecting protein DprA protein [Candidatus Wolfebacteria bacterium GW2011_GWE2_44_13]HBI25834.1 DNA-protecting protein DprA [Candidatus Wolfebacteria bacterium]
MERKFLSISINSEAYPALLKEIPDAPTSLFCVGQLPALDTLCIAIVGTRKATTQGKALAKRIAYDLTQHGIVVVSGLAMGIDTAAHEGAVEAGGKTIAVLAGGLDTIYPSQNTALADKIIALKGAILSEYPLQTPSYPNQFLARNRIVSGLCVATIVIEAPERSGTQATARFALEQGREVFVFPGPVDHQNYMGSHRLIRDGARLITKAEDIYEDLNIPATATQQQNLFQASTPQEHALLVMLKEAGKPLSVDKLSELTTLEAHVINSALATLVLSGAIQETERGFTI